MSDAETIDALSKAVGATDAGRRVGWARAFAAESSKEDLSRQLNVLRSERDIMRKAASFLVGFLRAYLQMRGDTAAAQQVLARWSNGVDRVLDDQVVAAGREAAASLVAVDADLASKRERRAEDKRERIKDHRRAERKLRAYERAYLVKKFGFPNEAAMLNWLDQYVERVTR